MIFKISDYLFDPHLQKIAGVKLKHPYAMAVWEDKLYWSDWGDKKIWSAQKKDGSNQSLVFDGGENHINEVSIFHRQMLTEVKFRYSEGERN